MKMSKHNISEDEIEKILQHIKFKFNITTNDYLREDFDPNKGLSDLAIRIKIPINREKLGIFSSFVNECAIELNISEGIDKDNNNQRILSTSFGLTYSQFNGGENGMEYGTLIFYPQLKTIIENYFIGHSEKSSK